MAEHHQKQEISEKNQEQQKEQRETIRRFHEEWANYLAKSIRESKDNEISEENKEELIEILSKYNELQSLVDKLKKREIIKTEAEKELEKLEETFSENGSIEIELFKNFRWFQGFYQKNRSESLLKQEEKKYLRYISKRLNELKNAEETKWLNWKELLKANVYQITMLSFKEKSQIINLIQKKELSKEDKKELITKLIRLKIEDLNKLFGKSFEAYAKNYVKWGTGWYEDPGAKRIILNNFLKSNTKFKDVRKEKKNEQLLKDKSDYASIKKLTVKKFFRLIKKEIENLLSVKVNYRDLSTKYLKMKNKWYVNNRILDSLRFTDYVLHTTSLNKFKKNLIDIFKEKSQYFEYIIDLYKSMNPYYLEKVIVISDYFKNIDTLEKAYWFGFLLAEAHIKIRGNNYRIGLSLSTEDAILIKKFAKAISFDFRRLKYRRAKAKSGKTTRETRLGFSDEQFCKYLIENGFPKNGKTSENSYIRFPHWAFSDRRFVMAMLLGFFDGDGSHHLKYPNLRQNEDRGLEPAIKIKSRIFLEDIKKYFDIDKDVKDSGKCYFELTLGKDLFNELLENYENSLKRKRYKYRDCESKFKFSKDELEIFYVKGWYDQKIADYHLTKYGIEIDRKTVNNYAKQWNLQKTSDSMLKWKNAIELLRKGWSLEEIYTKEFGYKYDPTNYDHRHKLKTKYEQWFAHDPRVKGSDEILRKIVEVYGYVENNILVITQRERVILRRKEGWSLERIFTEELGYKYDPTNKESYYWMRKKYKEIFKDDSLVMNSGDIIERIEEVYNPTNKL